MAGLEPFLGLEYCGVSVNPKSEALSHLQNASFSFEKSLDRALLLQY